MSVSEITDGRAGPAVEQRHLAEVLARSERGHLAVVAPHGGLTLDDEEELAPDGALLAEHPAGRHGHLLEGPRMVRRSLADEVENSQILDRSRLSPLMAANSSP